MFVDWPILHAKRLTKDSRKNPEYHIAVVIGKPRIDRIYFSAEQFAHSLLIATTTWYSGFFLLSFVRRFACDIGQSAKIWIWALELSWILRSSPSIAAPSAFSGYGLSVDQLITSLFATPCWRDPTSSKQLSTVAILRFHFGLYHVVAPLSFLRSISLASLFSSLSIFGWSDFFTDPLSCDDQFPSFSVLGIEWAIPVFPSYFSKRVLVSHGNWV